MTSSLSVAFRRAYPVIVVSVANVLVQNCKQMLTISTLIQTYAYIYIHMYIRIYMHISIYIYIYTHVYTRNRYLPVHVHVQKHINV